MKNYLFWGILLYTLCNFAHAQDIILQGYVRDAKTQEGIPDVSVVIDKAGIGISTNIEGKFVLRVPAHLAGFDILVAYLGYETYRQKISNITTPQNMNIQIKEIPEDLKEVALGANTPLGIVKKAYQRIPQNYPTTNTLYTGFYRESNHHQKPDSAEKCYYVIEAVTKINKPSYEKSYPEGDIKIIEARKNQFVEDKIQFSKWIAGAFTPMRFDVVKKRFEFISPSQLDNYQYKIDDFSAYYGREVYKISFQPAKASADYEGVLYIDTETYAIVKVDYQYNPKGLKRENANRGGHTVLSERKFKINYQPLGDKWYIQSIWQQAKGQDYQTKENSLVRYVTEYAVTRIDTNKHENFEYGDKIQWHDIFLLKNDTYKQDFWANYNIVAETQTHKDLLIDTTYQRKIQQDLAKNKVTTSPQDIQQKIRNNRQTMPFKPLYTLAMPLWVRSSASQMGVQYTNEAGNINVQESIVLRDNQTAWCSGYGLEIALYKQLSAFYQGFIGFGKTRVGGYEAGFQYRFCVSKPKKRPIFLVGQASYANLLFVNRLPDVQNSSPTPLRIYETTFEKERLRVDLVKQQHSIKFSLGVHLEISRVTYLFLHTGYLTSFDERNGLLFQNKFKAFTTNNRQKQWVDTSEQNLYLKADNKRVDALPFKANLFVNIGICGNISFRR